MLEKGDSETTESATLEDKENLKSTNRHEDGSPYKKKRLVLMEGEASEEKQLMEIAWEVGEKWEELGVALGLEYKVLQSAVGSEQGSKVHMKAFHMLREWRQRFGVKATYALLAKALEESGLNGCAQKHCYRATHQ